MDAVFLKRESCEISLHILLDFSTKAKLTDIRLVEKPSASLPTIIYSTLKSECPACQCILNINLVVHEPDKAVAPYADSNGDVKQEGRLEPSPIASSDASKDSNEGSETDKKIVFDLTKKIRSKAKIGRGKAVKSRKLRLECQKPTDPKTRILFCMYCFEKCETREDQRKHVKNHEAACRKCDPPLFFTSLKQLRYHFRNHHFESHPLYSETKPCPQCNERFRITKFDAHFTQCIPLVCEFCKKTFNSKSTLKKHRRFTHLEGYRNEFTCDVCGKIYPRKQDFDSHYINHQDDTRPYKCDQCPNVSYRTKCQIRNHIEITHLKKPDPMETCTECGLTMKHRYFKQHMFRVHIQGKIFKCSSCSKGFSTKSALLRHEKIHADVREFGCEICNQRFRQKAGLVSHLRLHTGEKPYECDVCQQRFGDRGCYRSHLLKHEKELGVTLDKSIKKFSRNSNT